MTTDFLADAWSLYETLQDSTDTTETRITITNGESAGVYIEVLPRVGEEADRIAAVDHIADQLGITGYLVAVFDRHYYQAETDALGVPVQVSALLAPVGDQGQDGGA